MRFPKTRAVRFLVAAALSPVIIAGRALAVGATPPPLPEGRAGIAAKYLGDAGIAGDPSVLFVESFDSPSLDAVFERWEDVRNRGGMSFSPDTPEGSADGKSLLMTHVGGKDTGGQLYRRLLPGYDRVFARFYVKFDKDCARIHHFGTALGGFNPSTPWPQGGAGARPDGAKRFTSGVEPYGDSWRWDFYTYWQGMRVHGGGKYWGAPFLAGGEKPQAARGEWVCVEMLLKMNEPIDAHNGEQAFWINGKLFRRGGQIVGRAGPGFPKGRWTGGWWAPDPNSDSAFEGFQWRTDSALNINYLWTYLYITGAPKGHVSRVWFDNIVVSTEYIGPIQQGKDKE